MAAMAAEGGVEAQGQSAKKVVAAEISATVSSLLLSGPPSRVCLHLLSQARSCSEMPRI